MRHEPRSLSRRLLLALALTGAIACALPGTAAALQHQNANAAVNWSWSGTGFWNVDQIIRIDQKARATFWANQIAWTGASYAAYFGLQTNGNRFDGTVGDTAIFSAWNANAARGASCRQFSEGGTGYSCRLAYPIVDGRHYRLRIWRQEADSGGQWWGVWVRDEATGVERSIGGVRLPASVTTISSTLNFVEYFGAKVACANVPESKAVFTQPAANSQGGGAYQYGSTYASTSFGTCVTGTASAVDLGWTRGVSVTHGGRSPRETRVVFTHGYEQDGGSSCDGTWRDMLSAYRSGLGWSSTLVPVRYYADDTSCSTTGLDPLANVSISSHGSHSTFHPSGHVERNGAIVGHSTDARIRHLAYHWAWMVHDRYTNVGHPIKAVGHSMGGLIMRSALKEIQAGNPSFPSRLLVEDIVTLGTPHTGTGVANACAITHEQCRDLRPDSDFLNDLSANGQNPQGDGGTEWTAVGASDDDTVTAGSATNMQAADEVVYASGQGIEHGEYMHKKTGADLFDFDAQVDVWHHGKFCAQFPTLFWPIALSDTALAQPVNDDC